MKTTLKVMVLVGFILWVAGVPFSSTARFLASTAHLVYLQIEALKPKEQAEALTHYIEKQAALIASKR